MEWWDVNSLIEIQLASMNSVISLPAICTTKWNMATCQGQRISPESYAFFIVNMDEGTKAIKLDSFVHQGLTTKETRNEVNK